MSHLPPDTSNLHNLDKQLRGLIENELRDGERITWIGQPAPRQFARKELGAFWIGLVWTSVTVIWTGVAVGFQIPDVLKGEGFGLLVGGIFLMVGLTMMAAPFQSFRRASRIAYVISTERVIEFEGGFPAKITSYSPDQVRNRTRLEQPDGTGNLLFNYDIEDPFKEGEPENGIVRDDLPLQGGFYALPDIQSIDDRIAQLLDELDRSQ